MNRHLRTRKALLSRKWLKMARVYFELLVRNSFHVMRFGGKGDALLDLFVIILVYLILGRTSLHVCLIYIYLVRGKVNPHCCPESQLIFEVVYIQCRVYYCLAHRND